MLTIRENTMSNERKKQIKNRFYKQTKEEKLIKNKIKEYKKDKDLIFVLKCRHCGKEHKIKQRYTNKYDCKCGRNLICYYVINHAGSRILFKNKLMKGENVRSYDPYRSEEK